MVQNSKYFFSNEFPISKYCCILLFLSSVVIIYIDQIVGNASIQYVCKNLAGKWAALAAAPCVSALRSSLGGLASRRAYHGNLGSVADISPKLFAPAPIETASRWQHVHVAPLPDTYRGPYRETDPEPGTRPNSSRPPRFSTYTDTPFFAIAFDQSAKLFEHSPYQGHGIPVLVIYLTFKLFCRLIKRYCKKGY